MRLVLYSWHDLCMHKTKVTKQRHKSAESLQTKDETVRTNVPLLLYENCCAQLISKGSPKSIFHRLLQNYSVFFFFAQKQIFTQKRAWKWYARKYKQCLTQNIFLYSFSLSQNISTDIFFRGEIPFAWVNNTLEKAFWKLIPPLVPTSTHRWNQWASRLSSILLCERLLKIETT